MTVSEIEELIYDKINQCACTCSSQASKACYIEQKINQGLIGLDTKNVIEVSMNFDYSDLMLGHYIHSWLRTFSICSLTAINCKYDKVIETVDIHVQFTQCIRKGYLI